MNMCSVRQSPIPSAPNSRAFAASSGVSAFARTPSRRSSSAQPRIVPKFSSIAGGTSGTAPMITSPVPPSIVITSPASSSSLADLHRPAPCSRSRDPRTPRRTAFPSRARRQRRARSSRRVLSGLRLRGSARGCRPGSSPSGRGSRPPPPCRALLPCRRRARSRPRPRPETRSARASRPRPRRSGSIIGWRSWSSCPGSMRATASSREISPSSTISTATLSAAAGRPLPGSRLQEIEPALLDGELDVLEIAVVRLEPLERLDELLVRLRQFLAHRLDRLGCPGARRRRPRPAHSTGTRRTAASRPSPGRV